MVLLDPDRTIVDHNPALRDLFRDNEADLRRVLPEIDLEAGKRLDIDAFAAEPGTYSALLADPQHLPHSGEVIVGAARLQLDIEAIHDADGTYIGAALIWRDIREAGKNASILESLDRNQTMLEFDRDFRVTATNDVFQRLFGWGPEAVGRTLQDLFGVTEDTEIAMKRLREGLTVNRKLERPTKDGGTVWIEVSMNSVRTRDGRLDRVVEIGTDVTRLETARRDAGADRAKRDAAQAHVVDQLRKGLSAFAEGDLTVELNEPFADEMERLRTDYNSARRKLASAVGQLIDASHSIGDGAAEISRASDDLAARTEKQAATLEETKTSLEEITTRVNATASSAQEADAAATSARSEAAASSAVLRDTVTAMSEMERSAGQIGKIISVIDDIAFQTNLLALNAGVEAARAGEAGRGFAVVATEVRGLAQRSADAAREITELIQTSTDHVDRGVRLVRRTGEALEGIARAVENVSGQISGIAEASGEQATGIESINSGVNQLDRVTQQNAAMTQEATAACQNLRSEADLLRDLVARFRTDAASGADHRPAQSPVPFQSAARRALAG